MRFLPAKTIVSKVKYGSNWFGIDYNMNLYKGCCHGCIYCDSRSECYQIENFDEVCLKENAIEILEKELRSKRQKGVIGLGAMSDTYNPFEKKYEVTRKALELINKYSFGVSIETKSDLIIRDIDILKIIAKKHSTIIKITITTNNDDLSKIIEPNVCVSTKRFEAVNKLSGSGLFVGVILTPMLPFITDSEENIKEIVKLSYENGAKFVYTYPYMGVTLRNNQREYYYEKLDKHFPGIKAKYIKYYGNKYNCTVFNNNKLYNVFKNECEKYGLLYNMTDIIKAYCIKTEEDSIDEQMTLNLEEI